METYIWEVVFVDVEDFRCECGNAIADLDECGNALGDIILGELGSTVLLVVQDLVGDRTIHQVADIADRVASLGKPFQFLLDARDDNDSVLANGILQNM